MGNNKCRSLQLYHTRQKTSQIRLKSDKLWLFQISSLSVHFCVDILTKDFKKWNNNRIWGKSSELLAKSDTLSSRNKGDKMWRGREGREKERDHSGGKRGEGTELSLIIWYSLEEAGAGLWFDRWCRGAVSLVGVFIPSFCSAGIQYSVSVCYIVECFLFGYFWGASISFVDNQYSGLVWTELVIKLDKLFFNSAGKYNNCFPLIIILIW